MTRALSLASECIGIERKDLFRVASEDTGLVPDAFSARTVSFARSTQNIDLKIAGGPAAQAVANALAWADVYLLSRLDEQVVEDLGIIALAAPTEAARLARSAESLAIVSQADRAGATALEDD